MSPSRSTSSTTSPKSDGEVTSGEKGKVTSVGPGLSITGPLYVGIDSSLTNWAVTMLEEDGSYLSVLVQPKLKGVERLNYLRFVTSRTLGVWGTLHGVNAIVMEGYSFGSKSRQHAIGEGGAATKLGIFDAGYDAVAHLCPPTTLKKFVTNKGTSKKNEMLLGVYKQWDVEFSDDNLADSYALAKVAYHMDNAPTLKYQAEALDNVEQGL